jgi:uncharacterized protein YjlB
MTFIPDSALETVMILDDGNFPGNANLPLVLYRNVLAASDHDDFEPLFLANGWGGTWRNGIFPYHHYHSTAHEAIGIARGSLRVQFGGDTGPEFRLVTGDAVVIPAGVAHRNLENSDDYLVIGAYPGGEIWDVHTGIEGERPRSDTNIRDVELPTTDPVSGSEGPLMRLWHLTHSAT